jgi:TetR/AcrR family transcriptional repressor of nem operon
MGNAKAEKKERSREKILASAGSLVREKGISGASVAEVMERAGMTVGGFYAHFPSKQSLVAETMRETLRQSRSRMEEGADDMRGEEWVLAVARSYLSRAHRDHPEEGCPLPTTLGELTREEPVVRKVLADELDRTVLEIASHLEEAGVDDPRGEALATLALMVGGLTLARALKGEALSDAVLKACRNHLEHSLPG